MWISSVLDAFNVDDVWISGTTSSSLTFEAEEHAATRRSGTLRHLNNPRRVDQARSVCALSFPGSLRLSHCAVAEVLVETTRALVLPLDAKAEVRHASLRRSCLQLADKGRREPETLEPGMVARARATEFARMLPQL
jgi:hypothetical protein